MEYVGGLFQKWKICYEFSNKDNEIKEVYVKIKANYMFIYEIDKKGNNNFNSNNNNQINQKQRHKSVKILNLCYLK